VDLTFTMIDNGRPLGNNVNTNEVGYRNEHPFVADPA
jgi:hypothetical protein